MKIAALIPARAGSKSIPHKNMRGIGGHPLIYHTIKKAIDSHLFDDIIVSTDDLRVASYTERYFPKVSLIYPRPSGLCEDNVPLLPIARHAFCSMKDKPDYLCILQATSPLRQVIHIQGAIAETINSKPEVLFSVTPIPIHPHKIRRITGSKITPIVKEDVYQQRQDLPNIPYLTYMNGAIACLSKEFLNSKRGYKNAKVHGYCMAAEYSIDIDTFEDLDEARKIYKVLKR